MSGRSSDWACLLTLGLSTPARPNGARRQGHQHPLRGCTVPPVERTPGRSWSRSSPGCGSSSLDGSGAPGGTLQRPLDVVRKPSIGSHLGHAAGPSLLSAPLNHHEEQRDRDDHEKANRRHGPHGPNPTERGAPVLRTLGGPASTANGRPNETSAWASSTTRSAAASEVSPPPRPRPPPAATYRRRKERREPARRPPTTLHHRPLDPTRTHADHLNSCM